MEKTTLSTEAGLENANSSPSTSSQLSNTGSSMDNPGTSTSSTTRSRPVFVKPKMQSFGKMGAVSEEYLKNRKARMERLKKQIIQKNAKKSTEGEDEEEQPTKKKTLRNVFTRMEEPSMQQGPLSVLYKSMKERKRVRVWTRSYRHVRGICNGIVIAFDKHFNMALVDVDEVYRPPKARVKKARRKRRKKKTKDQDDSEKVEEDMDVLTEKLNQLKKELSCLSSDDEYSSGSRGRHENSRERERKSSRTYDLREKLARRSSRGDTRHSDSRHSNRSRSSTSCSSRSRDSSRTRRDRGGQAEGKNACQRDSDREKHDANSRSQSRSENDMRVGNSKIKEQLQDELRERHVNQLFIRGDNVVMVACT